MKEFHSIECSANNCHNESSIHLESSKARCFTESFSSLSDVPSTDEVTEVTIFHLVLLTSHLLSVHLFPCSYIPSLFEQHATTTLEQPLQATYSWLRQPQHEGQGCILVQVGDRRLELRSTAADSRSPPP